MSFELSIPAEVYDKMLDFIKRDCLGRGMKTSKAYLAYHFFDDPLLTPKGDNMTCNDVNDRKVRMVVSELQNRGNLIVYDADSHDGGLFYAQTAEECEHYMNQEFSRYKKVKVKCDAMYHSFKKKFGAMAAARLCDGQMEFEFDGDVWSGHVDDQNTKRQHRHG